MKHMMHWLGISCVTVGWVLANPPEDRIVREILVPIDELGKLLEYGPEHVLLKRNEYEALLEQARSSVEETAPVGAVVVGADYSVMLMEQRAAVTAVLTLDVVRPGLQALSLGFNGRGLRRATLDERSAALGRDAEGDLQLFVNGVGVHTLTLELVAQVEVLAAEQRLEWSYPRPGASRIRVTAPGDVEIRRGASAAQRHVDASAGTTQFELVPQRGTTELVFSLNSRTRMSRHGVRSRAVITSEITPAFQRLHAAFSMSVLHQPVEQFRFELPPGFEVTQVDSPHLEQWHVANDQSARVLAVRLRTAVSDKVIIDVTAIAPFVPDQGWTMPQITPLEVEAQVALQGLFVDRGLQLSGLRSTGLIEVSTTLLEAALPASMKSRLNSHGIRSVAAYYSPQQGGTLQALFSSPHARLDVASHLILHVGESELQLAGGFHLVPRGQDVFELQFELDAGWEVTAVTRPDGAPLSFDTSSDVEEGIHVRVDLDDGARDGGSASLRFTAIRSPDAWLSAWSERVEALPVLAVDRATQHAGAMAIIGRDDLQIHAGQTQGLLPLVEDEKKAVGLGDVRAGLAYRFDDDAYSGDVRIVRPVPRVAATSFALLGVSQDVVRAQYQLNYDVAGGGVRTVQLRLPAATPETISFQGLDGVVIKETTARMSGVDRVWTLVMEQRRRGTIRVIASFTASISTLGGDSLSLPLIHAEAVAFQSGLIALEGNPDIDVQIETAHREVDIGEMAGAHFQPGAQLLGVYAFHEEAEVQVRLTRREVHPLPVIIVQHAYLTSVLSPTGTAHCVADFDFKANSPGLELSLPVGAELWSIELDGQPQRAQHLDSSIRVDTSGGEVDALRSLRIVYGTTLAPIGLRGHVNLPPPMLFLPQTTGRSRQHVPIADLQWIVEVPSDFVPTGYEGTVTTSEWPSPRLAIVNMAQWLLGIGGGVGGGLLQSRSSARVSAKSRPQAGAAPALAQLGEMEEVLGKARSSTADRPAEGKKNKRKEVRKRRRPAPKPSRADHAEDRRAPVQLDWALAGLAGLQIEVARSGERVAFRGLGETQRLMLSFMHRGRMDAVAWAVAFIVGLWVWRSGREGWRSGLRAVIVVIALCTAIPLLFDSAAAAQVLNPACYVAFGLVIAGPVVRAAQAALNRPVAAPVAVALLCGWGGNSARADESNSRFPPPIPIEVPDDAILVPFDPAAGDPYSSPDVMVPYAMYESLHEAIQNAGIVGPPPAPFAFGGSAYTTTLGTGNVLDVVGELDIEVFSTAAVWVPLQFENGVLVRAALNGTPAAVSMSSAADSPSPGVVIREAGRHQLFVMVRFSLEREGGWRRVAGRLPPSPAAALDIIIPAAGTDVRIDSVYDRNHTTSTRADEVIKTALSGDGRLKLQWRPRVDRGAVEAGLTVHSEVLADVQADGLHFAWRVEINARRHGQRELFVEVPAGVTVSRVSGPNVRGWEVVPDEPGSGVRIDLLAESTGAERFVLHYSSVTPVSDETPLSVPVLRIPGAAVHRGRITIRCSPRLEFDVSQLSGLQRVEIPEVNTADSLWPSPLGLRVVQSWGFSTVPFTLELAARPQVRHVTAHTEALVKVSQRERRFESRTRFEVQGPAAYELRLELPRGLELERVVAPEPFEWDVVEEADPSHLHVMLAHGHRAPVVLIEGRLAGRGPITDLDLPRIAALDVDRQQGQVVIQSDPALTIRVTQTSGCRTVLLEDVMTWLAEQQQALARTALTFDAPEYSAQIQIGQRPSQVRVRTITNVRATDRALEHTVLFDYSIEGAGVRRVSFLVPAALCDARIEVPLLRQKQVHMENDDWARVTVELQERVNDELRILLQHDLPLTTALHRVEVPRVQDVLEATHYVVLEGAGRDELIVDSATELQRLGPQEAAWRQLQTLLPGQLTHAYEVHRGAATPGLQFKLQDRARVQTTGARIGIAEALVVIDAAGAYRASQVYRLDNSTERFLEVVLPAGARLWTARVAGAAVRPAELRGQAVAGRVRIPLIKTATGDLDYVVELKYGGQLSEPGAGAKLDIPLVQAINVTPELSQVRLRVPPAFEWFSATGTMLEVAEEGDLAAGYVAYQTKVAERLNEALRGESAYAQVRAESNLRKLQADLGRYQQEVQEFANDALDKSWAANTLAIQSAEEGRVQVLSEIQKDSAPDNRQTLDVYFAKQNADTAKDEAAQLGFNFDIKLGAEIQVQDAPELKSGDDSKGHDIDGDGVTDAPLDWFKATDANAPVAADTRDLKRANVLNFSAPPLASSVDEVRSKALEGIQIPQSAGVELSDMEQAHNRYRLFMAEDAAEHDSDDDDDRLAGASPTPSAPPAEAAHLGSLDVVIPEVGRVLRFSTPRGDQQISMRAISSITVRGLWRALGLALLGGALLGARALVLRVSRGPRSGRNGAVLLIIGGIVSILFGVLPVFGVVTLGVGLVLFVRERGAVQS
jgi:hypothetical protein